MRHESFAPVSVELAASDEVVRDSDDSEVYSQSNADPMPRGMAGVKFQLTPRFYVMPEFNGVYEFDADYFGWIAALSFGFRI